MQLVDQELRRLEEAWLPVQCLAVHIATIVKLEALGRS